MLFSRDTVSGGCGFVYFTFRFPKSLLNQFFVLFTWDFPILNQVNPGGRGRERELMRDTGKLSPSQVFISNRWESFEWLFFFFLNQMLYFYGHTRVSVINALHAKRASSCGKKNSTPSKTPTKQVLPPQLFFIWMIKHCTSIRYMLWTQTSWFITHLLTHGPPTYFSLGFGSFSLVIIKAGEED